MSKYIEADVKARGAMNYAKGNPLPKDLKVKVVFLLTSMIQIWVLNRD